MNQKEKQRTVVCVETETLSAIQSKIAIHCGKRRQTELKMEFVSLLDKLPNQQNIQRVRSGQITEKMMLFVGIPL